MSKSSKTQSCEALGCDAPGIYVGHRCDIHRLRCQKSDCLYWAYQHAFPYCKHHRDLVTEKTPPQIRRTKVDAQRRRHAKKILIKQLQTQVAFWKSKAKKLEEQVDVYADSDDSEAYVSATDVDTSDDESLK